MFVADLIVRTKKKKKIPLSIGHICNITPFQVISFVCYNSNFLPPIFQAPLCGCGLVFGSVLHVQAISC